MSSLNLKKVGAAGRAKNSLSGFVSRFLKKDGWVNDGRAQMEMDRKLVFSLSKSRVPSLKQIKHIKKVLDAKELWILRASVLVMLTCFVFLSTRFYDSNLQIVPVRGGKYVEGLVGSPEYINPLYAGISDVDHDISALIYSSLFRRGKSGRLVPDLVKEYSVSEDGKKYTIMIRADAKWHDDGLPVKELTADDVIYTFNAIKDKELKSPLRTTFAGVEIERIDNQSFNLLLTDPYAAFLELLTFGIMPAGLWQQVTPSTFPLSELNLKPVGSGPYKFASLVKDSAGNIREYNLAANEDYYGGTPLVDIGYKFFADFTNALSALNDSQVDGLSYLPTELEKSISTPKNYNIHRLNLPQLTAVFFNQKSNPQLADKRVRHALALAINKSVVVDGVLGGNATAIYGPILPGSFAFDGETKKYNYDEGAAILTLKDAGWELTRVSEDDIEEAHHNESAEDEKLKNEALAKSAVGPGQWQKKDGNYLKIKLTTIDREENISVAEALKNFWEKIGVKTDIEIVETARVQTEVIRTRNFEALFYAQIVGGDPDPYAFWHSSQAGGNGPNIADFANNDVDQLIEDARLALDTDKRKELYKRFQEIMAEEMPAVFIYSSIYNYVQHRKINNYDVTSVIFPSDRFANINEWFIETGKRLVWRPARHAQ